MKYITTKNDLVKLLSELHRCYNLDECLVYLADNSVERVLYFGEFSIGNVYINVECADATEKALKLSNIKKLVVTRDVSACSMTGNTVDTTFEVKLQ